MIQVAYAHRNFESNSLRLQHPAAKVHLRIERVLYSGKDLGCIILSGIIIDVDRQRRIIGLSARLG